KGEPPKAAPAAPVQPAPKPAEAKPTPATAPKAAEPGAPPPKPAPPSVPIENVAISLAAIVKKLPQELQDKVKKKPGSSETVTVPIKKLAEQLQQGSVKVAFGELQKVCPPATFADSE